ncbi:MAG: hypothetical protein RSC96_05315 [Oscillospiraceae bacterium]
MRGLILPKMQSKRSNIYFFYAVILGSIMLLGILIGALLISADAKISNKYPIFLINAFLQSHKSVSFTMLLSFSFLSGMIIHILTLICGFSCVGAPFIAAIPFLRGMFMGCISGYLYADMGIKGVLLNAILFWLPQALQGMALIVFASYALDTSLSMFATCFLEPVQSIKTRLKLYVKSFIFTSLILFITAIFESLLSGLLAEVLIN